MSDETSSSPRPKVPAPVQHESGKYAPTVILPVSSVQVELIPEVVKIESAPSPRLSSNTLRASKSDSFNFSMDLSPTPFQHQNVTTRRGSFRQSLGANPIPILPPAQPPNVLPPPPPQPPP